MSVHNDSWIKQIIDASYQASSSVLLTSTVTVTDFLVGDRPHGFMQQNSTAGLGKRAGLLTVNDCTLCPCRLGVLV
jgi:hypothetical protein